jgi:glucan phosphoethanolaminetransferase (alkaline phosphatase superfamily)
MSKVTLLECIQKVLKNAFFKTSSLSLRVVKSTFLIVFILYGSAIIIFIILKKIFLLKNFDEFIKKLNILKLFLQNKFEYFQFA